MMEKIFNRDRDYIKENDGNWEKRGASEKPVGPQVPMNEQKPPGVKPEENPRTQASNSDPSS